MEGYFKLYRKILGSKVFANQTALKVWVWCLAKVNYKERYLTLQTGRGRITIKVEAGQFLFGRLKAERELGIEGVTVSRWMNKFSSEEFNSMITLDVHTQYTIVTINNWEAYQGAEDPESTVSEQPSLQSEPVVESEAEYYPVEEVIAKPEKPKKADVLFPEVVEEKKEKVVQFKNCKYSDKALFVQKLALKEFAGVNLEYYYHAVYDWSETKNVKRSDNGWIATVRNWIRRDLPTGKAMMLNKSAGGYGMSNTDFTDFLSKY